MNIGGHQNLALHVHPFLDIFINERQVSIPANIGVGDTFMRPIHSHDSTGRLHVESTCPRVFRTEEFFEIWGEEFTRDCILGYCENETHELLYFINGAQSNEYELATFADGDRHVIRFQARG